MSINEKFQKLGVVPVVVIENEKDAVSLADALCNGGLACAEVTFRTKNAAEIMNTIFFILFVFCFRLRR